MYQTSSLCKTNMDSKVRIVFLAPHKGKVHLAVWNRALASEDQMVPQLPGPFKRSKQPKTARTDFRLWFHLCLGLIVSSGPIQDSTKSLIQLETLQWRPPPNQMPLLSTTTSFTDDRYIDNHHQYWYRATCKPECIRPPRYKIRKLCSSGDQLHIGSTCFIVIHSKKEICEDANNVLKWHGADEESKVPKMATYVIVNCLSSSMWRSC